MTRLCLHCNKPLARRDGEDDSHFLKRQFCGRRCAGLRAGRGLSIKATQQRKRHARVAKTLLQDMASEPQRELSLRAGEVESIADYLARGGHITHCPSAYAAPVEHAMAEFGRRSGGRRG